MAEKARLASPHPYRGWRQWPDDQGLREAALAYMAACRGLAENSAGR